ncbi:IQ motif and SEC7 domain-containing protein [Paragonimus westermani]|uniref:IQ motif and SEC7 domain-containing protein n=1 Tax=Paragonimus westermani TaxID=34504 RepID=A0A5J4NP14_9TREM|nr:IQ motif and SEC7 domain-containing protein [Paragonimus westermani]
MSTSTVNCGSVLHPAFASHRLGADNVRHSCESCSNGLSKTGDSVDNLPRACRSNCFMSIIKEPYENHGSTPPTDGTSIQLDSSNKAMRILTQTTPDTSQSNSWSVEQFGCEVAPHFEHSQRKLDSATPAVLPIPVPFSDQPLPSSRCGCPQQCTSLPTPPSSRSSLDFRAVVGHSLSRANVDVDSGPTNQPQSCHPVHIHSGVLTCLPVPESYSKEVLLLHNPRPTRIEFGPLSYELGEDLRAKEIELIERCYGGRMRAQRAARIIQNAYREYRLRTEYARICLEKRKPDSCASANVLAFSSKHVLTTSTRALDDVKFLNGSCPVRSTLRSSGSLEDLVLEQAYVDWALKAATAQTSCGASTNSDSACAVGNEQTSSQLGFASSLSSHSSSESKTDGSFDSVLRNNQANSIIGHTDCKPHTSLFPPASEPDIVYSDRCLPHFSAFDKPGKMKIDVPCRLTPPVSTRELSIGSNSSCFHSCNCIRFAPAALSCELQRRRTSPIRKLSSPTVHRRNLHQVDSPNSSKTVSSSQNIRHSPNDSVASNTIVRPSFIRCTCHPHSEAFFCQPPQSTRIAFVSPTLQPSHCQCIQCSRPNIYAHAPKMLVPSHLTPLNLASTSRRHGLISSTVTGDHPPVPPGRVCSKSLVNYQTSLPTTTSNNGCAAVQVPRPILVAVTSSGSHRHSSGHSRNSSFPQHQFGNNPHPLSVEQMRHNRLLIPSHCHGYQHVRSANQIRLCSPDSSVSADQMQPISAHLAKQQVRNLEKRRKRLYRIGLNIFNKSPIKGVDFLIRYNFLDCSPDTIARFLLTRKGLSRIAIGDYLGNTKDEMAVVTTQQFMRELDFREQEVDEALRSLLSCFRTPGESQKIVHLLTEFQSAYVEQNSARVKAQFRNPDSVMVLAYAIVMLHTDMYSPNVRTQSKMTRDQFVRNLRGVDGGEDLDRNLLLAVYDRVHLCEMTVLPDHTDQVRKIQQHLTGPLRPINLALPSRRLVCYCRLYEVPDKNKKERPGAHQREVFLFNDLLLVTKGVQKKRKDAAIAYQVRASLNLLGVRLITFETPHHPHGLELVLPIPERTEAVNAKESGLTGSALPPASQARILITLNTKTMSDRARFMEDLQECILEVTEMDRLRIEEEVAKQTQPRKRFVKQGSATVASSLHVQTFEESRTGQARSTSGHFLTGVKPNLSTVSHCGARALVPDCVRNCEPSQQVSASNRDPHFSCPGKACTQVLTTSATACKSDTSCRLEMVSQLNKYVSNRSEELDPTQQKSVSLTDEAQRLSGDSGLLVDLDTPTSKTSRTLGSSCSVSSS